MVIVGAGPFVENIGGQLAQQQGRQWQRQRVARLALHGPASRSTCPLCRARVSPVRSPHECIRVKNATACHRHGHGVCIRAAAAKNNSISRRDNR